MDEVRMSRERAGPKGEWAATGTTAAAVSAPTGGGKKTIRDKASKELHELSALAAYWIFFLAAFTVYGALITGQALGSAVYVRFGWSIITGVVIAKMILIGDWLKLGERHHVGHTGRPILSQIAIYGPFVFVLMLLEKIIEGFFHGSGVRETVARLASIGWKEIVARTLIIVVAMVPFFAFREVARATGYSSVRDILRGRGTAVTPRG